MKPDAPKWIWNALFKRMTCRLFCYVSCCFVLCLYQSLGGRSIHFSRKIYSSLGVTSKANRFSTNVVWVVLFSVTLLAKHFSRTKLRVPSCNNLRAQIVLSWCSLPCESFPLWSSILLSDVSEPKKKSCWRKDPLLNFLKHLLRAVWLVFLKIKRRVAGASSNSGNPDKVICW